MHTGPNIVNDGLVFGYDTGEFVPTNPNFSNFLPYKGRNRFNKGKESVNYIAFQNPRVDPTYSSYTRGTGTWDARHPDAITVYNKRGSNLSSYVNTGVGDWSNTDHAHWQYDNILKKPVVVMHDRTGSWKAKSFGTGMPSWSSLGLTHGSKYTISWLQWVDHLSKNAKAGLYSRTTSGSNGFHDGQANSSTSYNTKTGTWERVYQTYTTSSVRDLNSTYLSIYMYGHYNVRGTVKISDVQLELGDHPTTYLEFDGVDSTKQSRTSTGGLIDLTKTTTINTNNVSFDSNGLMEFDGTNDIITVGRIIDTNNYSAEFVFKADVNNSNEQWLGSQYPGTGRVIFDLWTNQRLRNFVNGTSINGNTTISTGTWYHAVFTRNSSGNAYIYLNGVQDAYGTISTSTPVNTNFEIGASTTLTREFTGKIPITKIYNRVLTEQEIKQNYSAYKKRFN